MFFVSCRELDIINLDKTMDIIKNTFFTIMNDKRESRSYKYKLRFEPWLPGLGAVLNPALPGGKKVEYCHISPPKKYFM